MTPELRGAFEREWPGLALRLQRFLGRYGLPEERREDTVQETGLRLFLMWESVDRSRPAWALVKTIALNLLRDDAKRTSSRHPVAAEIPDVASAYDLEAAGLARIELRKVEAALEELTPSQRAVLLKEIGHPVRLDVPTSNAEKMLRMRARRKLNAALKRLSGFGIARDERWGQIGQALLAGREGAMNGAACLVCIILALPFVAPGGTGAPQKVPAPRSGDAQTMVARPAGGIARAWTPSSAAADDAVARVGTSGRERGRRDEAPTGSAAPSQPASSGGKAERGLPAVGTGLSGPTEPTVEAPVVSVPEPPAPPPAGGEREIAAPAAAAPEDDERDGGPLEAAETLAEAAAQALS